jgi:hypothetical protein
VKGLNGDIPIGVSKKCCQLCWQMKEYLNADCSTNFTLPGTHGTFYPWIPPPGVPDSVLLKIRSDLIQLIREDITRKSHIVSHSRQSSDAGSDSESEDSPEGDSPEEDFIFSSEFKQRVRSSLSNAQTVNVI